MGDPKFFPTRRKLVRNHKNVVALYMAVIAQAGTSVRVLNHFSQSIFLPWH